MGIKDRFQRTLTPSRLFERKTTGSPADSAAQVCPEDILHIILSEASQDNLARIARVCRGWSRPAMDQLYDSIEFNAKLNTASAHRLALTLRISPEVRRRIRRLKVDINSWSWNGSLYSWLKLFDANSRLLEVHITLRFAPDRTLRRLLASASFPTAIHVAVEKRLRGRPKLKVPLPQSLVSFAVAGNPEPSDTPSLSSSLQRVTFIITDQLPMAVLHATKHSLRCLHLLFESDTIYQAEEWDSMVDAVLRMPQLTELLIGGKIRKPGHYTSVLDRIVPHLPNLRYLYCGASFYTPSLLTQLPTTIEVLCLGQINVYYAAPSFDFLPLYPTTEILELVHASELGLNNISRLYLGNDGHRVDTREIEEACLSAGIQFWMKLTENYWFTDMTLAANFSVSRFHLDPRTTFRGPRPPPVHM